MHTMEVTLANAFLAMRMMVKNMKEQEDQAGQGAAQALRKQRLVEEKINEEYQVRSILKLYFSSYDHPTNEITLTLKKYISCLVLLFLIIDQRQLSLYCIKMKST